MMKHSERKLAIEAQNLCWSFLRGMEAQHNIARSGPTQESKMLEFRGDFPQLSNIKPEILIRKAELMRYFDPLPEEVAALKAWKATIHGFPPFMAGKASEILLLYRGCCNRENKETKKRYTHADCAKEIGISKELYDTVLEKMMMTMQMHYSKLKSQHLAKSIKKDTICSSCA